jgi:hypothetical protein
MSRISRGCAGAMLLAACMAIPAMAQAQASMADRILMNRIGPEFRGQVGANQPGATRKTDDHSQASRALLGTVDAIRLTASEPGAAESRFPTAEQALLGQSARPKDRKEN